MSVSSLPQPGTRWRRILPAVMASLVLLLMLAYGAAHALFDGERLIALARAHARSAWSRELDIGRLSLSLLPTPTLRAEQVSLSNPDWARQPRMAQIDRLDVRLALLPLLSGHIAPLALRARGVRLDLERDAQGRANWRLGSDRSHVDWSHLNVLHAEAVALSYSDGDHAPLELTVPDADLRAKSGWKEPHLVATLTRNAVPLRLDARCADLSRIGEPDAQSACDLAATVEGARVALSGTLPLARSGSGLAARLDAEASDAARLLAFLGLAPHSTALSLRADLESASDGIRLRQAHVRLGTTEADGSLRLHTGADGPRYEAELAIPRLDWAQLSRDAGHQPPGKASADEMFRRQPLPWPALETLAGIDGRLKLHVGAAKLRSGVDVSKLDAEIASGGGAIDIHRYAMHLLGGSAEGGLRLEPGKRRARLKLAARNVLLERWFSERGRKLPLTGGPMTIDADVSGHGESMAALAATLDGSIDVHGGRTVIRSERAGEAEKLLTDMLPLFSEHEAQRMTLECFAGRLRFVHGRAADSGIAGARSDVSQLLTSGWIDLREQQLDLRGRVRSRHGVPIGVSVLSSDVRIHGPLKKPGIALDAAGAPGALARLGAAFLTGGLSIIATAAWDAANPATDACAAVFRARK